MDDSFLKPTTGHTEPIANYDGGAPLTVGLVLRHSDEDWVVIRIDETVFHMRRRPEYDAETEAAIEA